ncbi:MAG: hypothetical protein RLZ98_1851 [Pseudomonadota bacterium]|jgi:uncharacterized protein (UPF0262 family)
MKMGKLMPEVCDTPELPRDRLVSITLDEATLGPANANVEHEREVAIFDLIDRNAFALAERDDGPYRLVLSILDDRLVFNVAGEDDTRLVTHMLSLTPLRRVMRDYFKVCESYYDAIRTQPPSKIQALDMGRRAVHDEGSRLLTDRLDGKIIVDKDTARRLFTLVCALHWKG